MALQIGVEYELFWSLNPKKLRPFVKAYENTLKQRTLQSNYAAWISGIYATYAIASAMSEHTEYPEKPLALYENEHDIAERKAQESQMFSAYAAMFNRSFDTE